MIIISFWSVFILYLCCIMNSRCENCIIRQFNSLRAMSKEDLKKVSDNKTTKVVKKGDAIFDEGEKLNGVYCVRNGISKLSKLSCNGKDQIVKFATKGEILGQRSVVVEESTNLSAVAVSDMEVCFVPKDIIMDSVHKNPNFTSEMLRHMAHELKEADDVIVNMSQKPVKQRLVEVILYLQDTFGTDEEGYLSLVLSREDIANVVGTATESAIRLISQLKKEKLISTKGKRIKVEDLKGMNQIANAL